MIDENRCIGEQLADGIICEIREDEKIDLGKLRALKQARKQKQSVLFPLAMSGTMTITYDIAMIVIQKLHDEEDIRKITDAISEIL